MQKKAPSFSRKIIIAALGFAVIGAAVGISHQSEAAKPENVAAAPTPVTVAPVVSRSIVEWDEFSGRVEAIEYVDIRPRVAGTIVGVHFKEGQLVKAGDLLFSIDPRPYQAELARAEAEKAQAAAALNLTHTELERTRRLAEENAVAKRELDQRSNAVLEAEARLKAAEAAVMSARLNLQYASVTAPVSGRVSRAEITVGNLVGAGLNTPPLTTLVSVSPVYVNFEIDEQTYQRYAALGASGNANVERIPVSIGLSNEDGYPHAARLQAFDNRVDTQSGTIRVRAVVPNRDNRLTPGMYARVRIGGGGERPALLIDDKAIGTDQDKKFVMVVGADNKAVYRPVTLGPVIEGMRVVRSGLEAGEQVIVNGLQRVRPNDQVAPVLANNQTLPQASIKTVGRDDKAPLKKQI
jgi:membrane fusion protein, multidrug efflux system